MKSLKTLTILYRTFDEIDKRVRQDIKTHGLNPTEFGTIEVLFHKGELSVQAITQKVLIPPSSMSYVLDTLERKGLIIRTRSEGDRRKFFVRLSEKGHQLFFSIYPLHEAHMREVFDVLSEEEELTLQLLLKKIGKNL